MGRLGLVGGVSPAATIAYYRRLNALAAARFGGETSANLLIASLDYARILAAYEAADWDAFAATVVEGARALAAGGAEAIAIASNTTHLAADAVVAATGLPLIHIQDALADALRAAGSRRPLLLGTEVVMTGPFWRPSFAARYDGAVLIPDAAGRVAVGEVIFGELTREIVTPASRARLLAVVETARREAGADGVVLGCTELGLILDETHTDLPVFDTTALHARAAFEAVCRD